MNSFFVLSLFGRSAGPFLVPVDILSAAARGRGQGRPSGRRVSRLALDAGKRGRTVDATAKTGRPLRQVCASVCSVAILTGVSLGAPAIAQPQTGPADDGRTRGGEIARAVSEAAVRFGLPEAWIYAVMRQESGGRVDARSPKGAMGLLQLMPSTWRELTLELSLGDDPFDVRANVLAGSAYLRRMYDRFGAPGFLGAYNAGPQRYAGHLSGAQTLPLETQIYIQRLAPLLDSPQISVRPIIDVERHAPSLFVARTVPGNALPPGLQGHEGGGGLWP
jgi:hypothetical protein